MKDDSNPQTFHDLCTSTPLRTAPPLAFTTHEDPHPPPHAPGPNYTSFVQYCEEDLVHIDRQTPPTGPTSSLRSVHSTLARCPQRLICLHTSHTVRCGQGKALAPRPVLRSSDEGKARQGKARQGIILRSSPLPSSRWPVLLNTVKRHFSAKRDCLGEIALLFK